MRAALLSLLAALACGADGWPGFRGLNGSGVSPATGLPVQFGPAKNVIWKTPVPPGFSSPVLTAGRIFLTAAEGEKLLTLCLDRATGKVLWQREAPRDFPEKRYGPNSPAASSPVTDGSNVYVFFGDFGLISYGPDGAERWRRALGPFHNPYGDVSLSDPGRRQGRAAVRPGHEFRLPHPHRPLLLRPAGLNVVCT